MNIYVANISFKASNEQLKSLFEQYGTVSKATIVKDRDSGRSKGFGFVEMEHPVEANNAISNIDQTDFLGRTLTVKEANPRS